MTQIFGKHYHRDISKQEAEDLLYADDGKRVPGKFLLRDRVGTSDHILSVIYKERATHHMVILKGGKVVLNGQDTGCVSFPELENFLSQKRPKWPVPLVQGVQAPGDGDDHSGSEDDDDTEGMGDFYHGTILKAEAEKLLLANGGADNPGKFLFRSLNASDTDFILSVVYKGRATHHKLSMGGPGGKLTLNNNVIPCKTFVEVQEFLNQKRPKWPVPLTDGVRPDGVRAAAAETSAPAPVAVSSGYDGSDDDDDEEAPAPPPRPSLQDTNNHGRYLHGQINKESAKQLLLADGGRDLPGKFLFRRRGPSDLTFILSVVYKRQDTHHKVERETDGDDFKLNGNATGCYSLQALEDYLRQARPKWPVPLTTGVIPGVEDGQPELPPKRKTESKPSEPAGTLAAAAPRSSDTDDDEYGEHYHGSLKKMMAEKLLYADNGKDVSGKFLFRCKPLSDTEYILSVIYKEKATHHSLVREGKGQEFALSKQPTGCTTLPQIEKLLSRKMREPVKWPVPLCNGVKSPKALAAGRVSNVQEITVTATKSQTQDGPPELEVSDDDITEESNTDVFPYLHEEMTKGAVDVLLLADQGKFKPGKFLFRKKGDMIALSVVYKERATHHALTKDANNHFIVNKGHTKCGSLEELTKFLRTRRPFWPVPLTEGVRSKVTDKGNTGSKRSRTKSIGKKEAQRMLAAAQQQNSDNNKSGSAGSPSSAVQKRSWITKTWRRKKLEELGGRPTVIGGWGQDHANPATTQVTKMYDPDESERRHRRSLENIFKQPAVQMDNGLMLTKGAQKRMSKSTVQPMTRQDSKNLEPMLPPTAKYDEECTFLGNCTCPSCRDESV